MNEVYSKERVLDCLDTPELKEVIDKHSYGSTVWSIDSIRKDEHDDVKVTSLFYSVLWSIVKDVELALGKEDDVYKYVNGVFSFYHDRIYLTHRQYVDQLNKVINENLKQHITKTVL